MGSGSAALMPSKSSACHQHKCWFANVGKADVAVARAKRDPTPHACTNLMEVEPMKSCAALHCGAHVRGSSSN
jgi:hypothetical protein